MYPVRLGIDKAISRIKRLIKNGHHAEALLTSVFTFEKTIHRTLKQLIVSSGFRNADSDKLLKQLQGFNKQKEIWACFDPEGRSLPEIIGNNHWQHIGAAVTMRNNLVHGARAYKLEDCKRTAENILDLIDQTITSFNTEYGYDGWSTVSIRRKSTLHSDPKVKINA